MYFPYFRGKQFELIALRELAENRLIGNNILPIIEPVKFTPTLTKTLEQYVQDERFVAFIGNPQVGNFVEEINSVSNDKSAEKLLGLLGNQRVLKSHITNENTVVELKRLFEQGYPKEDIILIHGNRDYLKKYSDMFEDSQARYNLIPDESVYRKYVKENTILFNDNFAKKKRNTDYLKVEDEFFSEDHLNYCEYGFKGFADYSVIGSDYTEAGFAPYAVAIHIVYFDNKNNLRIRHFVSDSNEDTKDPAGKFGQALLKLVKWNREMNLNTYGINQFVSHYENGTYPGLGTVKKLSVMHHVGLMSNFLDGVY